MALPATGGILTALVVFVFLVQNILVGLPLTGVVPNDLPLNLVQPASLVSVAPVSQFLELPAPTGRRIPERLLLEATLNAEGEVVFYKILSGPSDKVVTRQLDQVLMFSRFRPQAEFWAPHRWRPGAAQLQRSARPRLVRSHAMCPSMFAVPAPRHS